MAHLVRTSLSALRIDLAGALWAMSLLGACAPHPTTAPAPLAATEFAYLDLRDLRDTIDVARARGASVGAARAERYAARRAGVAARLDAVDTTALDTVDRRAHAVMRETLVHDVGALDTSAVATDSAPACDDEAAPADAGADGEARLRARIYACYGRAAHHVVVDHDTLDRLTVLGLLARTDDPARRATLFQALAPVWRAVNGDDGPTSPYRMALRLTSHRPPSTDAARTLGVDPDTATRWLIAVLDHWCAATPDRDIEPWDFYYAAGAATRAQFDSLGALTLLDTGDVVVTAIVGMARATATLHVAPPPTILFDMRDQAGDTLGNRDVYRVALDGAGLTRLSSGAGDNFRAASAAGVVTFTSFRSGDQSLYQVPLAGGAERSLDSLPYPAAEPATAVPGGALAFISAASGIDKLWTASADGRGPVAVTAALGTDGSSEENPTWSPDGSRIVFVTTQYGNAALVELVLATGVETPLTSGATTNVDPAWSPDGTRVAFASTRDGDAGILLLTRKTGAITRLMPHPGNDGQPAWLPDGRLMYASFGASGGATLHWIDPAAPSVIHAVPTPAGADAQHPTAAH